MLFNLSASPKLIFCFLGGVGHCPIVKVKRIFSRQSHLLLSVCDTWGLGYHLVLCLRHRLGPAQKVSQADTFSLPGWFQTRLRISPYF